MVKMRNLLSHVYDDDDIQDIWLFLSSNKKFFVQKDKEIKKYLDTLHAKIYND
jgi:uncharacterized protein with HEPN domain